MAIDPKLVSIIPASQLPTGDPTNAADFLFYEGDALKKGSMSNIYDKVTSGIKGVATQTNAPTAYTPEEYPDGLFERYLVHEPLTAPNSWSNIVVTSADLDVVNGVANNRVILEVNNGVATKRVERVKGDAGSVPIVQTSGTSTTDTMSQKAVTDFAQPFISFPFISTPISAIQRKTALAIRELYISNYDSNYDYYLVGLYRKKNFSGLEPNLYGYKVTRKHKVTNVSDHAHFTQYNRVEPNGYDIVENNDGNIWALIDWKQLNIDEAFDVDFADAYLINPAVSEITSSPILKDFLFPAVKKEDTNIFIAGAGTLSAGGERNLAIGDEALMNNIDSGYNLAIGDRAMKNHRTGAGNVAIGMDALRDSEECIDVTAVGWEACKEMVSGVGDTALGRRALGLTTKAGSNTALGDSTLYSIQANDNGNGRSNVAIGYTAAEYCVDVKESVIVGYAAARTIPSGGGNVILGNLAMFTRTTASNNNVCIGSSAMYYSTAGDMNTVIGSNSGNQIGGNKNTIIGFQSGNGFTSGTDNIIIGAFAGNDGGVNYSNCVIIGNNKFPTASNQIKIGNATNSEFEVCGVTFTKAQLVALKALVS